MVPGSNFMDKTDEDKDREELAEELKKSREVIHAQLEELRRKNDELASQIREREQAERKLSEQAFTLSNISDAVIGMDADYRVNYWSPSAERMYGYCAEEVLGRPSCDVFKPDYLGVKREDVLERLRSTGHIRVQAAHTTKDGRRIIVESHSQLLYDEKGNPYGLLGTNRDITGYKRAEEELLRSYDELETLVQERTAKLQESEERFRIALQNSPITVATLDKDLRYTWAYHTRHGFRPEDVLGKRPDE